MIGSAVKVFISHSSVDTWVARQIGAQIRLRGATTFLDYDDVEHGDDFEDKIVDAATTCTELLVLFTPWSRDRKYIWLEIGIFRAAKKRIVIALYGVKVNDVSSDERIPSLLKKIDLVNLNDIDTYFSELSRRTNKSAGEEARNA
jgi:hypothetical protein